MLGGIGKSLLQECHRCGETTQGPNSRPANRPLPIIQRADKVREYLRVIKSRNGGDGGPADICTDVEQRRTQGNKKAGVPVMGEDGNCVLSDERIGVPQAMQQALDDQRRPVITCCARSVSRSLLSVGIEDM